MNSDPLGSRRFLAAWSAFILLLAPGAALVRPMLGHPAVYWIAFLAAMALSVLALRSLGPAAIAAIRSRPRVTVPFLLTLMLCAAAELAWDGAIPVERFHFVLFGLLGIAAARRFGFGAEAAALALIFGGTVSVLDELFQHYLASRVGDFRDVFTDLRAIALGVIFIQVLHPARRTRGRGTLPAFAAVLALLLTWLLSETQWGSTITMPGGSFFSHFSPARLTRLSQSRNYLRAPPPVSTDLWALEDHYYAEGIRKLKQRNDELLKGLSALALFDNVVLETYYGPVLDAKSGRWSPAMSAQVAQQASGSGPLAPNYGSTGPERAPLVTVGLGCAAALLAAAAWRRRPSQTESLHAPAVPSGP